MLKEIDTAEKVKIASEKKRDKILAQKILKKYKNLKKPKKTYLVEEKDIETIDYTKPQEDIFAGESIINAPNKMLDFKQFKREQEKLLKKGKKGKAIIAKNILKKYKTIKKPKKTYLINENNLETIDYSEPQEDIFAGESILNAANKVFHFTKFKHEQEKQIQGYNENLLNDAETINYVDDIDINDLKENKNLKIAAKKIQDKYKKIRQKRKVPVPIETLHTSSETCTSINSKKSKKVKDKRALIAARNITKKYKDLYRRI